MTDRSVSLFRFTIAILLLTSSASAMDTERAVSASGVRGGLVVHLGAGDGSATAALRANGSYIVHGLEADAAKVAAARERLQKQGVYGPVSIRQWSGGNLPYANDLAALLVADSLGNVPMAEVMRVLAPRGVAMIGGKKTVKPWPDDMDEWPQYLHDSGNTRTANDTRVGPPRRLRWHAGPRWSRSHEFTSSVATMITGAGRVFYVFDQGLSGITGKDIPQRWTLIARDAHSGVLLWKKPLPDWGSQAWRSTSLRGLPRGVMRRIVVDGDRLYITLGYSSPISVLDAATGKLLQTFEKTDRTDEIVMHGDKILARIRAGSKNSLMLINKTSGKTVWRVNEPHVKQLTLAMNDTGVFFASGDNVTCRSLAGGKQQWQADLTAPTPRKTKTPKKSKRKRKPRRGGGGSLVLAGSKVLYHSPGNKLFALGAKSGKVLWQTSGGGRELFVAHDKAWQGYLSGVDLETGKTVTNVDTKHIFSKGHHIRCYSSRATTKYVISPNRGTEFISMTGGESCQNDWLRGPCTYGVLPSNGLLYVAPHPCFCYGGVMLLGFNAMAAADANETTPSFGGKLIKGPAYGAAVSTTASRSDWPTYRRDARRTGASPETIRSNVKTVWTRKIGGKLTTPVLADGKLFISAKSEQRIYALDADTGKEAWTFTPDARVDSPPTVHNGQAIFGCADGWVYCLRATDGVLAWRFQAAPAERMIVVKDQLESPWRVHGGVLIHKGLAYFTAGRS
ncbi:MAG: PQQ-binding-like beta-propeller repeat protein, partial [Phycisphaerae bacterium]|nr:PQQ-binding-like beta-propeller repeat protein [Phycisphaerae bacterium]